MQLPSCSHRLSIIQGGMHYVGFAEMAAAVSMPAASAHHGTTQRTPELLAKEIARCRDMTDKPFGVNLTFCRPLPRRPIRNTFAPSGKAASRSSKPRAQPEQYMPALKAGGIKVIHKCTSVRHSAESRAIGCDAAALRRLECGGHPAKMICQHDLLPRAAEELKIPFCCFTGAADGARYGVRMAMGAPHRQRATR